MTDDAQLLREPVKLRRPSPDRHEPFGLRKWQRAQHDGIDDTEYRRRRPDAECQREHCHGGEAGVLQQFAEGEFQIIHGSLKAIKG